GAVDVARPGVSHIRLEPASKAAVQPPLHRVVDGISLTGEDGPHSEIWMKTLIVWLPWVDIRGGQQPMALRAEIGTIQQQFVRKLPLEPERPALRVTVAEVFLEGSPLVIQRARRGWSCRQLRIPVGRSAAGARGGDTGADGIR